MNNFQSSEIKKGTSSKTYEEKRHDFLKEDSVSCSNSNEQSWNSTPSIYTLSISNEEGSNSTVSNSQSTCPDYLLKSGWSKKLPIEPKNMIHSRNRKFRLDFILNKQLDAFEVVAKGTRLMKSLKFPTVIVKLLKGSLKKSMMYYLIVEPENDKYRWQIPCVMFSNPNAYRETRFAELLPLYFFKCSNSVALSPMLLRKRYKRIFRRGCSFNVQWLEAGRSFDYSGGKLWRMYDLRNLHIRDLIRGFIEQDINSISLILIKMMKTQNLSSKRSDGVSGCETRVQRKATSLDYLEFEESSGSQEITGCRPWDQCENKKFSQSLRDGSGRMKIPEIGAPQRCIYKSTCDEGTSYRKDSFSFKSFSELDKYWHVSGNEL